MMIAKLYLNYVTVLRFSHPLQILACSWREILPCVFDGLPLPPRLDQLHKLLEANVELQGGPDDSIQC